MKLLEILGIHETSFKDDETLFTQIKKSYKKLAFTYHPDRTNGDEQLEARFKMISEIYAVLSDSKYRKYYIDHHAQLDTYFQEDKYSDFLTQHIKGAIVDTDKVNLNAALNIYTEQLTYFSYNQSGLNHILLAIDAAKKSNTNNPFYPPIQHLSHEAKAQYLLFIEGRKEEIDMAFERAKKVFSSQNIQHDHLGLKRINDLMNQLQRNDHNNVPKDLFEGIEESRYQDYIIAYYDVLSLHRNHIDFLYHRAQSVVSRQPYEYTLQSIVQLGNLITQINEGNYAGIPQELFVDVDESSKASLTRTYLECLTLHRDQIAFVFQRAEEVIKQQNFLCNQKSLAIVNGTITQITQGNSLVLPPQLFANVDDNFKAPLQHAYLNCLIGYKNHIEFTYSRAQAVIDRQNFRYDQHSLEIINQQITEISQGNRRLVPQDLFLNVHENNRDDLVFVYVSILDQYKTQIEQQLLEENRQRLELLRKEQEEKQRIETQQRLLQEQRHNAEVLINDCIEQINKFPVSIPETTSIESIQKQRTKLLQQLSAITQGQQNLAAAINILHANGTSPEITHAIDTKTEEINLATKKAEEMLRLREEQKILAEQRRQEELNRKQEEHQRLEEQRGIAEVVINIYVEQINKLPVSILKTTSIETIRQQQTELLQQLTAITQDQPDLAEAINILHANGKSPKITRAINTKTEEINLATKESEEILRLREEQKILAEQRRQEELNRKQDEHQRLDALRKAQEKQDLEASYKEQQRKRFIRLEEKKIDNILDNLAQRVGGIDQHHFDEARETAENLLNALQKAKIDYLNNLDNLDTNIEDANEDFKQICKTLIDGARSVLERDLGWGSYLTNLCKTLGNVLILVTTFGQVNNFFKLERAESIRAAEEAELQLNPVAI